MPACPACGSTSLETDYTQGIIFCQECGTIVQTNILVAEVGFAEGSGGRIHQQGTTIGFNSTGVTGNRSTGASLDIILQQGNRRIEQVCEDLGIHGLQRAAMRVFNLAVNSKFNRGRRSDFVVASCIYLASRIEGDKTMLIDLSERLKVNVYELGATYSKLLTTLALQSPQLTEVDPANYNLRFAHQLEFGSEAQTRAIAADASRLVKRFQADWMSSGRRPAGICGACLLIAARMNNFLRTPEEVAQVVKVSPDTVRRRLIEFAQTEAATKTVSEWRAMTDDELARGAEAQPPVVKKQMKAEAERQRRALLASQLAGQGDDDEAEGSGSGGAGGDDAMTATDAVRAVVRDMDGAQAGGSRDADDDDRSLAPLQKEDYAEALSAAGTTAADKELLKRQQAQYKRDMRRAEETYEEEQEQEDLAALAEAIEGGDKDGDDGPANEDEAGGAEAEDDPGNVASRRHRRPQPPDWTDEDAVIEWFDRHHLREELKGMINDAESRRARIVKYLGRRDPEQLSRDLWAVREARDRRDAGAAVTERVFDDLDDAELDRYWVMDADEREARARMWLSANGRWVEEDKERRAKRAADEAARGPAKPKQKRRRTAKNKHGAPGGAHKSAAAAMQSLIDGAPGSSKAKAKISSRLNYGVLSSLGHAPSQDLGGLQTMDELPDEDEKEDYADGDKEDEYDDGQGEYDEDAVDDWPADDE